MARPEHKPCLVYMVINLINGKRYIGMTSKTISKRWIEHKSAAVGGSKCLFHKAIRKYGPESFKSILLEKCDSYSLASKEEIKQIARLKPEYNLTAGGEGQLGKKMPDHVRAILHKPKSQEAIKKLRDAGLRDRKKWLQRSHLGPKASAKRVICISDGMIYESASEAARNYSASKSAVIELCLGKKFRKTVNGRVFKYCDGAK